MQKVDQALGRVIRGSTDRGRALLIDSRYGERQYRELLPPWWNYQALVSATNPAEAGRSSSGAKGLNCTTAVGEPGKDTSFS